jgi:hypothetical protein
MMGWASAGSDHFRKTPNRDPIARRGYLYDNAFILDNRFYRE